MKSIAKNKNKNKGRKFKKEDKKHIIDCVWKIK